MCTIRRRPDSSAHRCCEIAFRGSSRGTMSTGILDGNPRLAGFTRRFIGIARWLFPSAILVLLPKCPACFAAYVAIATGLGLREFHWRNELECSRGIPQADDHVLDLENGMAIVVKGQG